LGDFPPSTCDLAEPPESFSSEPLTVATFWKGDDEEGRALTALMRRAERQGYATGAWLPDDRVKAQLRIKDSFDEEDNEQLPDLIQVNGGSDVLRWVSQRREDATELCPLDRLRDHDGWSDAYFGSALKPLTCRDHLFGLPIGIHNINVLFYNKVLYGQLQAMVPPGVVLRDPSELGSVNELLEQLRVIDELGVTTAQGKRLVPLALGASKPWPLTVLAFENVLLSLSQDAYRKLWHGELQRDDEKGTRQLEQELRHMLEVLRELVAYSNADANVDWQTAMRQVGSGEAVMTVTGDWGWAQLIDDAQRDNVVTVPYPGTADSFVYTPDSFAVPRELHKNGFPAAAFLRDVVADKEAVLEFSNLKHSVPARNDLTETEVAMLGTENLRRTYERYAECDRAAFAGSGQGCQLLLAVSGLAPPPGAQPCTAVDALLTLAVTGRKPTEQEKAERFCAEEFPETGAEAEERLIELLLSMAKARFAADCR
jgi:hypothetical protein